MSRTRPVGTDRCALALMVALAAVAAGASDDFSALPAAQQPNATDPSQEGKGAKDYASPLEISAAEFRSVGFRMEGYLFQFTAGGPMGVGPDGACLMAPVYLPDLATITQLWLTLYDNDPTYDVEVYLYKRDNFDASVDPFLVASVTTSGQVGTVQNLGQTGLDDFVFYPQYSYFLATCLRNSNTAVLSARVWYN
jgi:hypothetical protein